MMSACIGEVTVIHLRRPLLHAPLSASLAAVGPHRDTDDVAIITYEWSEAGNIVATGETPAVMLGLGIHPLDLRVVDGGGLEDTASVEVEVDDRFRARLLFLCRVRAMGWLAYELREGLEPRTASIVRDLLAVDVAL